MNAPARTSRRKRPTRTRRILWSVAGWVAAVAVLALIGLIAAVAFTTASLPSYREMMQSPQGQSVVIRAADGTELVNIGPSYGRWVPHREIPAEMVAAMKAVEDRRYDWHPGIDPIGIARAFVVNLRAGRKVQGGSTITQQLARNIFLTLNQTYDRKLREIIVALAIERKFTKAQIMELYLNRVYFGGGAYGIDAASRKFFGHPATEIDTPKAAIIAGLVKAPSRYSPTADPERARSRAGIVLATMEDAGAIDAAERQRAAESVRGMEFVVDENVGDIRYFTDWVLAQLDTLTDEAIQPLEVVTTLVPAHQAAAEAAVKAQQVGGTQAAIIGMRTDGAVTALVGGRDYRTSNYNRAVTAQRQPGSSWKLFDYLVALEAGMTPDDRVVDEPLTIGRWSPRNSNRRFLGEMTLRQAFALSVNTVAVRLAQRHGFDTVASMARRFGITTPISTDPAMALGTSDVTLLQLTAAYAAIAGGGVEARPWAIRSIGTANGDVLYHSEPETPRVLVAPFVANYMTDMMKAAAETGTGRAAQFGRPMAGKTGTTSSNKDGWFLGFTPDLVAGVWMGRDDARAVAGLAGGQAPARIFQSFMSRALKGVAPSELSTEVDVPDFGLEPDAEVYGITPGGEIFTDDTRPISAEPPGQPSTPTATPEPMSDAWLEDIIGREPPARN